jgi:hypothetical protein
MKSKWQLLLLAACAVAAGCSSAPPKNADAAPDVAAPDASDGGAPDAPVEVAPDVPADVAPDLPIDAAPDAGSVDAGDAAEAGPEVGCSPWTGDRQWGTAREDTVLALSAGPGGFVAGGYVGGTLYATNIEPSGDARGFVRAISPAGQTRWDTTLDATGTETVDALAVGASDEIVVAGRTTGAFSGFTNKGQQDAFVAWLSPAGALATVRQFGDERPQHPRRIVFTPTGVAVGGFDDVYVPSNYVDSWENSSFATLDAPPSTAVAYHAERTTAPDYTDGFALDPLGSGDFFQSYVVTAGQPRGLFVRRVGADGTPRWTARFAPVGIEIPGPILALPDGTLWVAASWARTTGTSDPAVIHVDGAKGELIDAVDFPSVDGSEEVTALTRDARGDLWLAGNVAGLSFRGAQTKGELDAFVFHLASDGKFIDAWQGSTPGQDTARGIAVDGCGNVILAGSTEGALVEGATPLGASDAYVLRVPLEIRK